MNMEKEKGRNLSLIAKVLVVEVLAVSLYFLSLHLVMIYQYINTPMDELLREPLRIGLFYSIKGYLWLWCQNALIAIAIYLLLTLVIRRKKH